MDPFKADQALQNHTIFPRYLGVIPNLLIVILLFMAAPPGIGIGVAGAAGIETNCNQQDGACSRSLAGIEITLDIRPKPVRTMQDLIFKVTIANETPDPVLFVDLGMPGMNMGPNRVILKKKSRYVYEGKGVIVRCPSGRRTWQATVTAPGRGKTDFIFDVVY